MREERRPRGGRTTNGTCSSCRPSGVISHAAYTPLGRSSGTVRAKSSAQPASSRSSRWKWMAPYWCGASRKQVSSPRKLWPVTARAGRLTTRPCRPLPDTSRARAVPTSREKSHAPATSLASASVARLSGRSAHACSRSPVTVPASSRGRSMRPSKWWEGRPAASRAPASISAAPGGGRIEAASNTTSAGGSSGQARTGRRHAVPSATVPSSRTRSDRANRYHVQRRIAPSRATTLAAPMTCRSPSAESASAHPVPSNGMPWPAIT